MKDGKVLKIEIKINAVFDGDGVHFEEERIQRTWRDVWQ